MTQSVRSEDAVVLRFGGGRNSRSSEDQIHDLECYDGENFVLDTGNGEFRPRPPFDLVGTVPNAAEVRGFLTLLKTDGTVKMGVQAGGNVYELDSGGSFTLIGTVDSSAKLRGRKEANWALADKVLIADINGAEEVYEWDGTTFQASTFFESDGSTSFPTFRAKYIVVEDERAYYGNIYDGSTTYPHLLVGSQRGNYSQVVASGFADAERGSASGIGADAPFFLPMPQLKPINGMDFAFGVLALSQEDGAYEKLTGDDASDFQIKKLYDASGAAGDEASVSTENDIIYGARGRVESLKSTDKFGDVENDDISFRVRPDVKTYTDWTLAYNPATKRVYCFPASTSEIHVLHTEFIGSQLSPWSKYTTQHSFAFQPTAIMLCRDPVDGLEYVFMGDASGNVYRLDGTGSSGDGGNTEIVSYRLSKMFAAPLDAKAFNINGYVQHRKLNANTLDMVFRMSGEHVHDVPKSVTFAAVSYDTVYGDAVYYGGDFYYGVAQEERLIRRQFKVTAQGNAWQVRTEVTSSSDWAVTEIGMRFDFAA